MGRMYTVPISAVSVSVAQDLWELAAADDHPLILHALFVSQSSDTDSEQIRITVKRITGSPTSGSGGSAPTPAPLDPSGSAAGFTAEINNTTQLTGGTAVTLHEESFNVLNGYVYLPTPEMRPKCAGNQYLLVSIPAPADALTMNCTAYVEEV